MSRILIAASDEVSRHVVSEALSDRHDIQIATDGWAAIDMVYDEPPDAVMSDLQMPGLTGLGILAATRAKDPMLPVVIFSANNTLESAVEALRLGAYDYILKPLDVEIVRTSIDRALEVRALREENVRLVHDLRRVNTFKSQLLRTVSHDFKNLLTVIQGYGKMAQMATDSDVSNACMNKLFSASRYMESLSEDLSTYGLLDAHSLLLNVETFDLRPCVEEAVDTVLFMPEEHRLVIDDPMPLVRADRNRTTQILINLIGNAVKYSPRGGDVRIGATIHDDGVRIFVADSGLGIPKSQMQHLFHPFFRLERDESSGIPGTGLGLTIVKNLVEMQGGRIWVESREGRGTTFHFTLPA